MKFTWTFQLSVLSFTNRKDSVLILLLPSGKEKRTRPSPVGQHHLPIYPEPNNSEFGVGRVNVNCVYFMSYRKLTRECSERLSWKKKKVLSYAVYLFLFRKIHCIILSWDWEGQKKKTCRNTGFEVWLAHRIRLFSVFRLLEPNQRPPSQTGWWQKWGWATQEFGAGAWCGVLKESSWTTAQWLGEDPTLLELFGWEEGAAVLKNWDFSSW